MPNQNDGTIEAKNLAELLNISKKNLLRRANKEEWPYELGGRRSRRFIVKQLPADIRVKVIQFKESFYQKGMVLPTRADLDLGQAKEMLKRWDAAPGWCRTKAEARGEIVDAFGQFARGQGLTTAKNLFVKQYNAGNDGLGISAETHKAFKSISRTSLDLWRGYKKQLGLVGLLESEVRGKPKTKITHEMAEFIIGLIADKPHRRPTAIHEYLVNKFSRDGVTIPHPLTTRRFVNQWKARHRSEYQYMKSPDKWRSKFQPAFGGASEKAKFFLHYIEFDNTRADIQCADGRRYTASAAVDIFTRQAKCLIVPTSRSIAVAALMRWIIINWGLFDVAVMDNGRDYMSKHIEAVCGALDIEMDVAPVFTPEYKPHMERFFGTLARGLFEELAGYIGHSVAERKEIESQKSFAQRFMTPGEVIDCRMMPDELQQAIDTWIERIYHQRAHGGIGKSPERKKGESKPPVRKILDERALDILLAPVGKSTVSSKGIRYRGALYQAVALADHIGEEVQRREDLSDAGKLYIFSQESQFICVAKDAALEGLSVEEVNEARNRKLKQIKERVKAMKTLAKGVGDPMIDLLAAKAKEHGKVFGFTREQVFENETLREAAKAFLEPEPVSTFKADIFSHGDTKTQRDEKIIPIREARIFHNQMERYKYLQEQMKIRELTEREKGFVEGYQGTDEYYQVFVMPYE